MQKRESDIASRGSNFSILQISLVCQTHFSKTQSLPCHSSVQKHSVAPIASRTEPTLFSPSVLLPVLSLPHQFFHYFNTFSCMYFCGQPSDGLVAHSSEPLTHGFGRAHLPFLPASSAHGCTHCRFSPCASFIILGTQMNTSFVA